MFQNQPAKFAAMEIMMAVVMAAEWVQYLARLQSDLDQAVSTAREAALKPWWR